MAAFLLTVFLSFLCVNQNAIAQAQLWQVNPDHSEIRFEVSYLKVSTITGRFTQFAGEFLLDSKQSQIEKVMLTIDPSSVFTGNRIRDAHLKEQAFFHVAQYPRITFEMAKFTTRGKQQVEVEGKLTIKGQTHPVKVLGRLSSELKDTWNHNNIFIWFETKINRNQFGMGWNKSLEGDELLVGNEVAINGVLQLQPQTDKTPTGKHRIPDNNYMRLSEKKMRGEISEEEFKRATGDNVGEAATSTDQLTATVDTNAVAKTQAPAPVVSSVVGSTPMSHNVWFFYLCFLAFLATILIFYLMKKKLMEHLGPKYSETNFWGIASDVVGILLTMFYAIAVYQLGK